MTRVNKIDYPQYPTDEVLSMSNLLYHLISIKPFVYATVDSIGLAYLRHLVNSGAYRRLHTMPHSQVRNIVDVSRIYRTIKNLQNEGSVILSIVPDTNLVSVEILEK
jgi:hypothetical protein